MNRTKQEKVVIANGTEEPDGTHANMQLSECIAQLKGVMTGLSGAVNQQNRTTPLQCYSFGDNDDGGVC
jgi:hypothetical protein